MEKNLKEILSQFDSTKNNYERLLEYIEATIKSLMENEKIQIHEIKGRIKDRESLSKKIETKDYKYSSLSEITDICGIRIITYFSDDVDKIASLLEEEFDLDQDNSIDKRKTQDPTKFGYVSLHYILKLGGSRAGLTENINYKELKFEVQIRTILQHAWAEIEHDFGYKSDQDVPEKIRRRFSRLAGLIELADDEFMEIKRYEKEYTNRVEEGFKENSKSIKIDSISISALLESESYINFIEENYDQHNIEILLFQRPYVWHRAQWTQLFNDLLTGFKEQRLHFLGSIILKQLPSPMVEGSRRSLIDGQQRLKTFPILVKSIYDLLDEDRLVDYVGFFVRRAHKI